LTHPLSFKPSKAFGASQFFVSTKEVFVEVGVMDPVDVEREVIEGDFFDVIVRDTCIPNDIPPSLMDLVFDSLTSQHMETVEPVFSQEHDQDTISE
jgi:hypothetical protein